MKANQPDHQVATMCGVLGGSPGRRYARRGRSGCWPCALPESDSDPDGETQLTVSLNRARTAMNFPSLPDPSVMEKVLLPPAVAHFRVATALNRPRQRGNFSGRMRRQSTPLSRKRPHESTLILYTVRVKLTY